MMIWLCILYACGLGLGIKNWQRATRNKYRRPLPPSSPHNHNKKTGLHVMYMPKHPDLCCARSLHPFIQDFGGDGLSCNEWKKGARIFFCKHHWDSEARHPTCWALDVAMIRLHGSTVVLLWCIMRGHARRPVDGCGLAWWYHGMECAQALSRTTSCTVGGEVYER